MSNEEKSFAKTSINCLIAIYLRTSTKPYFIRDYENSDNAYFIWKIVKISRYMLILIKKYGKKYKGDYIV